MKSKQGTLACLFAILAIATATSAVAQRPIIVVVLCDDLGQTDSRV